MFHSNTEQLIDYWRTRDREGSAPTRASINPADLTRLLPQIFMAGRQQAGQYRLRLVGGFVAELHGCDLREQDMLRLWETPNREPLQLALEVARRRSEPLVVECDAPADHGAAMSMEVVMAPLVGPSGEVDRLIGLYQPTSPVAALRGRSVRFLSARAIRTAAQGGVRFTGPRLAALDGRQIA